MVNKRGLAVGAAALGGVLLLAGVAKASGKPKPAPSGGGPTPEDPYSQEACTAYYAERADMKNACAQLAAQKYDIDVARINAYQNGDEAGGQQLDAMYAQVNQQLQECNARLSQLNNLIAGCEANT